MPSDTQRLTAREIYDRVLGDARSELNRSTTALAYSGLASGLFMGLTGLGVAGATVALPSGTAEFIPLLFYPLGFIAVVIGRAQLFTENTLFPVVLILEDRRHFLVTLRLWTVVLVTNVIGALAFAALVTHTGALRVPVVQELVRLGVTATDVPLMHVFTSAIVGGWLIALMSWLVTGAQRTTGQVAIIWLITFPVGLLHLAHCIASSGYILVATLAGSVSGATYAAWLGVATAGNIIGGVVIVSLLNYGQVRGGFVRRRRPRASENGTLFRDFNEDLARRGIGGENGGTGQFLCECSDPSCTARITMSEAEYRHLRTDPRWYAVVEGHENPDEPVVERREGYVIVTRNGRAAESSGRNRTRQ